jgi:hypothetical protein
MLPVQPQRYIFPSAVTCLAVAILPVAFFVLLAAEMRSPSWNTDGDNGVAGGSLILAFEAAILVVYSALAFPLIAFWLQRRGIYSRVRFVSAVAGGLMLLSLGVAAFVTFSVFGNTSVYIRQLQLMLVQSALLCLPFTLLWLRLAK